MGRLFKNAGSIYVEYDTACSVVRERLLVTFLSLKITEYNNSSSLNESVVCHNPLHTRKGSQFAMSIFSLVGVISVETANLTDLL